MDDNQPESTVEPDAEVTLLMANVDAALLELDRAQRAGNSDSSVRSLESALHTYGTVKHLLPKLQLGSGQRAAVEKKLAVLRARIVS